MKISFLVLNTYLVGDRLIILRDLHYRAEYNKLSNKRIGYYFRPTHVWTEHQKMNSAVFWGSQTVTAKFSIFRQKAYKFKSWGNNLLRLCQSNESLCDETFRNYRFSVKCNSHFIVEMKT